MKRNSGLWTATAVGIAAALWAASAGCAGLFGDGDSARIEVVNDLPVAAQTGAGIRITVQSVDRPEVNRLLGSIRPGETKTFSFGPAIWDRSYRLIAGGRTSSPVALGPGMKVVWRLSTNIVRVEEPPLEKAR